MKFARYLQDTQTSEWKKAYIDYRGLKKRIANIRRWQEGLEPLSSSSADEEDLPVEVAIKLPLASSSKDGHEPSSGVIDGAQKMDGIAGPGPSSIPEERDKHTDGDDETLRESEIERPKIVHKKSRTRRLPNPLENSSSSPIQTPVRKLTNHRPQLMPFSTSTRPHSINHSQPMPLHVLLPTLPIIHIAFFTYLDKQLEKVDKFYSEREKEAQARSKELEIQLRELKDHRKVFYHILTLVSIGQRLSSPT
ncbi:hypothetical protein PILCRDRAFT_193459 [Piloderma croceum F 1598]|uniref:SPX domain-containing protein n=1 Tax=Piloderma croceum (strain F 1598) TaxID=765440 RepID=A0A0C3G0H3_PILCF|nr:hypothetical protein PILCRDRAFT_193459 [Piloderma croceum F 1598]